MRFRWCGDADCPDWALAEMTTLSRLSSVKLKLLATLVVQGLANPPFNIEKAEKLFTESKLDADNEVKRCVSCIAFIMRSAARSGCDAVALGGELQQLGLPREHAQALKRVYTDHIDALRAALKEQSLRVNQLSKVKFQALPTSDLVEIELLFKNEEKQQLLIPRTILATVLQDLRGVLNSMEELASTDHIL